MRYSKQRDCILNVVQKSNNHLTANDVYQMVKKEIPNISLGTIYRNLNVLVKNNFISSFIGKDEKEYFDKSVKHHFHIFCQECNHIFDIDIDYDFEKQLLKHHFQMSKINLTLEGICQECQKGKKV